VIRSCTGELCGGRIANSVSCLDSSLIEGSFEVQEVVGSNLGRDMSRNALLKDGDHLGQVLYSKSTNVCPFFSCLCCYSYLIQYYLTRNCKNVLLCLGYRAFLCHIISRHFTFLKFLSD
jgi:hypothetical protein